MKGTTFPKKIIFSSWFQALIPAVILMFFLPPLSSKYKLIVTDNGKSKYSDIYVDLNSDSITEIVRPGKGEPYYYLLVLDNDINVYNQWNFKDSLNTDLSVPFFGNYDNDLYKEIYIFSYRNDSIFLNINEFFEANGKKENHIFITKVRLVNNQITSLIVPAGFYDLNGDGYKELYFSIQTGFGLEPRAMYCYDIFHNTLKSSALTGIAIMNPQMCDVDGDGKPEFFGSTSAADNNKTEVPFNDKSTWLMVYNENLGFKFPPVEVPGITNFLVVFPDTIENFKGYILSHNSGAADTSVLKPRIMIFSSDGVKIRERPYADFGFRKNTFAAIVNDKNRERIFLVNKDLVELNNKLEVINTTTLPFHSIINTYPVDIKSDGNIMFLIYSEEEEKMVVYNTSMRKIGEAKLKFVPGPACISYYISKEHERKMFLSIHENGYFIDVNENKYYMLGYISYPGIYLLFFLFINLIKRINTLQVVEKESLNRRLVTLQLQGIKSQLDPHFTFNTLNSIASLIYLEDRQLAYDYMNKFTQLLRGLINDAERIYRSLGEELEFVITYLDLEKLRFGERFNYEIFIDDSVSQREQVPKLVLHTFAENAIKHGIMSRSEGGILKIKAKRDNDYLILSIEDNGIGRAKAEGQSTSTGKGLKLTGEFYDILNQINKRPIKHNIIDLHNDSGESIGTRVEVYVPVD